MAEGIDRKADDKLEFVSSKEVSVAPTFEAMVSASSLQLPPCAH